MAVQDIFHNRKLRLPPEWRATRSQQPWLAMHACNAEQRDCIISHKRPRNGSQVCKLRTYVLCPMPQPRNSPMQNTRCPHCIANVTRNPECCTPPLPAFHCFSGRARSKSNYITSQCPYDKQVKTHDCQLCTSFDRASLAPH